MARKLPAPRAYDLSLPDQFLGAIRVEGWMTLGYVGTGGCGFENVYSIIAVVLHGWLQAKSTCKPSETPTTQERITTTQLHLPHRALTADYLSMVYSTG